eukprot:TRINITY_DN1087_c0_g1_i3.p1 TRINITY_DN1087_c0_g1~~TRINITY_DN1087_c0_g1_i3.p1  ORF type:complete len:1128 (-),score=322.94 TRINITY_DN1087_c0_g1_i3:54-3437(-)
MGRTARRHKRYAREGYPAVDINNQAANAGKGYAHNRITTTKYTLYNFLPKNLFEQFRRITNIYFLLICIITLIPQVSPLNPVTSIAPLAFVLIVTAIKEGFEDYHRYKSDKQVNNRRYLVLNHEGVFADEYSKDIRVGQIVKVMNDQPFPADLVVISTSEEDGACYIETAQLDGETNLKIHRALPETFRITLQDIANMRGQVECDVPHPNLYKFKGALTVQNPSGESVRVSLSEKQLMLRGAQLRNTDYLLGVVVYVGKDSKLSLNQKNPPSKFSTVERRLNRSVIGVFFFKLILCMIASVLFYFQYLGPWTGSWYMWDQSPTADGGAGINALKIFFSYFAFLSFLIPVSLMVTLEVVKVSQAQFMDWDDLMSSKEGPGLIDDDDEGGDVKVEPREGAPEGGATSMPPLKKKPIRHMSAKTSNLNDELSLVKYVFSDKTGTLTENRMVFSKCSVSGTVYHEGMQGELREQVVDTNRRFDAVVSERVRDPLREFLIDLALCHAVVPTEKNNKLVYQSQSPDEVALAEAARRNDFVFLARTNDGVTVSILGEPQLYPVLAIMEFSSDRRRMSVIVRSPEGRILLYSKGADSMMLPRLMPDQLNSEGVDIVKKTQDDIEMFSQEGLRTLILAMKEVPQPEFEEWYAQYQTANSSMGDDRDEQVEALCDQMERGLVLLGATAIEDKLQDGVPETIEYLLQAGIKVWVITGDKQETAINIGHSCKLLTPVYPLVTINAEDDDQCRTIIERALDQHYQGGPTSSAQQEISMVIDGHSLTWALQEQATIFLKLASICHSVVCCRVTPLQKALVVRLIKKSTKEVCLSIGDGANDVSMIQEANVGVGIFGKEGTQAARSSDYALLRFRHLARLITVHGRYSGIRNSGIIKYSFYKNMAFFLVQFWYSFYNGYSAMTLYDDWIITFFNIFITSVPPYFMALFDKDVPEDVLAMYPQLYRRAQSGHLFTFRSIFFWLFNGFWHSILFFFGAYLFWQSAENTLPGGWTGGRETLGIITATFAVTVILLKAALVTRWWNVFVHIGIWGSLVVYAVLSTIDTHFLEYIPRAYGAQEAMLSMLSFWVLFVLMCVGVLVPDVTIKYLRRQLFPEDWHIMQERYYSRMVPVVSAPPAREIDVL